MEIKKMELGKYYVQNQVSALTCQTADKSDLLKFQSAVADDTEPAVEYEEQENTQTQDSQKTDVQNVIETLISYLKSILEKLTSTGTTGKTENTSNTENIGLTQQELSDSLSNDGTKFSNTIKPLNKIFKTKNETTSLAQLPNNENLSPDEQREQTRVPYIDEPDESVDLIDGKRTDLFRDIGGIRYYYDNEYDYYNGYILENFSDFDKEDAKNRACGTAEIKPEWGEKTEFYLDVEGFRYYFNSEIDKIRAQKHIVKIPETVDGKTTYVSCLVTNEQPDFYKLVVGKSPCE